jgi:hypothetical protein
MALKRSGPVLIGDEEDEIQSIHYAVIARSEATKQSRTAAPYWIASLRSQ